MDFSLSEEQKMLQKAARDFLTSECSEKFIREIEAGNTCYSPDLWHKMADLGWLGLVYPERYGGTEGSILDLAILYQEIGRAMLPSPHLSTVVLGGLTILAAGSEEQKASLLPRIVNGDLVLALALTEPEASWDGKAWDAEGVTVRATGKGDDYVIDGTKTFVHDAHIADYLLCVARTKVGTTPEDGITLFLVDAKSPGISYTLLKTVVGDKQSKVVFDKVKVPKKNIVGKIDGGWSPLAKVMQQGAVLSCAEMVGIGERVLELAVEHAKTRVQFEQPIGIHQYVQEHCVYALSDVDGSRWVTHQAAWKLSNGLPCDMEVAIAKAWTSEAIEDACWRAHQVLAGVGYTANVGLLPLYSRRAKIHQLYLGDAAHYRNIIARQIDRWPALEIPRGKPLGYWEKVEDVRGPEWWDSFAEA